MVILFQTIIFSSMLGGRGITSLLIFKMELLQRDLGICCIDSLKYAVTYYILVCILVYAYTYMNGLTW